MRARHTRLRFGVHRNEAANAPRPLARSLFDPDAIRALADILTETGLTEIEIADKDSSIRVARNPATPAAPSATVPAVSVPPPAAKAPPPAEPAPEDPAAHPGAVLSPMVGVVYLSPEPAAPAYVTVGQSVAAGQKPLPAARVKRMPSCRRTWAYRLSWRHDPVRGKKIDEPGPLSLLYDGQGGHFAHQEFAGTERQAPCGRRSGSLLRSRRAAICHSSVHGWNTNTPASCRLRITRCG